MEASKQKYLPVSLITTALLFALSPALAKTTYECEVRYLYSGSKANDEGGKWTVVRGKIGQFVPVKGGIYLKQVKNTGQHDVNVYLDKRDPPLYLHPKESRNTSEMRPAAIFTKIRCLATINGKQSKPATTEG